MPFAFPWGGTLDQARARTHFGGPARPDRTHRGGPGSLGRRFADRRGSGRRGHHADTTSGKFALTGGRQGHHDQGGYNYGELVTLNSSGGLTLHCTEGKGALDWKRSGPGWTGRSAHG
jgi:hypothetical protein